MLPASIEHATAADFPKAARLLFADAARAARCVEMLASGEFDADGLFVARTDRVCGAVLVQPLGGGLGLAWPPGATSHVVEDALLAAALGWLRGRGVTACQAFADADELPAFAPLRRHGFKHVTQLVQMRRDADPLPPSESRLAFSQEADFARVFFATHAGSLDCPELNAARTGVPHFTRAFVARYRGEAVGVVALDAGPAGWELAYLGLIPSARGRGFGGELVRHAVGECDAPLSLSVDARNEPALRLYRRHGFGEVGRREAFLAVWPAE